MNHGPEEYGYNPATDDYDGLGRIKVPPRDVLSPGDRELIHNAIDKARRLWDAGMRADALRAEAVVSGLIQRLGPDPTVKDNRLGTDWRGRRDTRGADTYV